MLSYQLGKKVRSLRISSGLTQNELSDGIVSRNMLSMIESGKTLPSVDTIEQIAKRLGVTVSYLFSDAKEEAIYKKSLVIERMRSLYEANNYEPIIKYSENLLDDGEIALICAMSHIKSGMSLFRTSPYKAIEKHFEPAARLKLPDYIGEQVEKTYRVARCICDSLTSQTLPRELYDMARFTPSFFPSEMFVYFRAVSALDVGDRATAEVLLTSGLIHSEKYLMHLKGKLMLLSDDVEAGQKCLIQATEAEQIGVLSQMKLYADVEQCSQKIGDYETAYKYSAKHIALIEELKG